MVAPILVGAGCSLIEGTELESHKQTWTYKVAERCGFDYCNAGHASVGNKYIAKRVIEEVSGAMREVAVIVQWTYISRYDYLFSFNTQERNSPWYTLTPAHANLADETVRKCFGDEYVSRIREYGTDKWAEYHYKMLNEHNDMDNTLSAMLMLQEFLKNRNIPYLFTSAERWRDYKAFTNNLHSRPLYDNIDWDRFKWFPHDYGDTGFVYWANANKFPLAPLGHPLEPAHEAAADIMEPYFREILDAD